MSQETRRSKDVVGNFQLGVSAMSRIFMVRDRLTYQGEHSK